MSEPGTAKRMAPRGETAPKGRAGRPRDAMAGRKVVAAWRTSNRATTFLIEQLPAGIWSTGVPGMPRLTVGMVAAHLHNSRCRWIRALGAHNGVSVPRLVDLRRVRPAELTRALSRSSEGLVRLTRSPPPRAAVPAGPAPGTAVAEESHRRRLAMEPAVAGGDGGRTREEGRGAGPWLTLRRKQPARWARR